MAERKYGEANTAFEKLSGYLNADEMAKEADYRHAVQYADANDFDNAVSIMTQLSKTGYKDAEDKVLEIQYRNGVYLLVEEANYSEANKIFTRLAKKKYDGADEMQKETQYLWASALIEDEDYVGAYKKLVNIKKYSDVKEVLEALEEVIYKEGQRLYYNKKYSDAKAHFDCISSYEDSNKYLTLITAHQFTGWSGSALSIVNKLSAIFYFEDASQLLLLKDDIAEEFLRGTWNGNGYYFTMNDEGSISYNLPWFDYGDYYKISNGEVLLFPKNKENSTKKLFFIEAITPDCIEVFCYKNSRTYTLNRQ